MMNSVVKYGLLIAPAFLMAMPEAVQALRPADCPEYEEREVSAGALGERTYSRLERIYEEIGDEEYTEAYEGLQALLERRLDDFERATVYQAMGHVAGSEDRISDAIEYFQRSVELDRMPNNVHFEMKLQIANLYYSEGEYQETIDRIGEWLCVAPEDKFNANVFLLRAGSQAELDDYASAIDSINIAIDLEDEPREQWFRMRLGMELELDRYEDGASTLRTLIDMDPDRKEYWTQLSAVMLELDQEEDAMAVLKLAHRKNLLDSESEFRQLASLLQAQGNPYLAARVLRDAIDAGVVEGSRRHWEQVAGAMYEARETDEALVAYDNASDLSEDGRLDLQRANILSRKEDWPAVVSATEQALDRGGLTDNQEGEAYQLIGMAHFNEENLDAAEQAFAQASNYSNSRRAAEEWLNHIRQERERREQQRQQEEADQQEDMTPEERLQQAG